MTGLWPIGSRPIGALRRVSGSGPAYSVFTAAGIAAMAAVATAKGSMVLAGAGVGAFNALSGPASGSLAAAGSGVLAATATAFSRMAVTSAGIGAFSGAFSAVARFSATYTGVGAMTGIMIASASSSSFMQGSGAFGGADRPGSAATLGGVGVLSAVGYAFFADAETAGPPQEVRVAYAPQENRYVIVPGEDRVYEVSGDDPTAGAFNRKRTL